MEIPALACAVVRDWTDQHRHQPKLWARNLFAFTKPERGSIPHGAPFLRARQEL